MDGRDVPCAASPRRVTDQAMGGDRRATGLSPHGQDNAWENFAAGSGLSNPFVWSVLEDSSNHIWAGTWGGGLFRLEGTNFVREFDLAERGEPATALMESPAGKMWIGTAMGLMRCADGKIERFARLGGAAAGDVRVLESGTNGEIWFGTQGSGLGQFKDGQCRSFHLADGLPSEFILSLHRQADGRLWIGTLDRGICLYENERFHTLGMDKGLPNNSIGHIEDDGLGNFWFTTQQGLFRANINELVECAEGRKANVSTLVFGKAQGLATVAASDGFTPSGFRAADGRLWFPTPRGIAVVNPKTVRRNSVPPPVWIEEMLVDGQRAEVRLADKAEAGGEMATIKSSSRSNPVIVNSMCCSRA